MNPQYPVYVLSYDRWQDERRKTIQALERMNVPYKVIVEPEEVDLYAQKIDKKNILEMPQQYHYDFDPCCEQEKYVRKGSGPPRNFAWDHSIKNGYKRHWIIDDNIRQFQRMNRNRYYEVQDGTIFKIMEDFVDRYKNIALAGPNYTCFVPQREKRYPITINTRIYSCLLIKNDIPFRWRAKYNDDTDISLRVLKAGYATVLFNAFLQDKLTTQSVKGGLTDQIYLKEGTVEKSKMIVKLHPDVARLKWRYGRWHHIVDYTPFKNNKLIPRDDIIIKDGIDEYGMRLIKI